MRRSLHPAARAQAMASDEAQYVAAQVGNDVIVFGLAPQAIGAVVLTCRTLADIDVGNIV